MICSWILNHPQKLPFKNDPPFRPFGMLQRPCRSAHDGLTLLGTQLHGSQNGGKRRNLSRKYAGGPQPGCLGYLTDTVHKEFCFWVSGHATLLIILTSTLVDQRRTLQMVPIGDTLCKWELCLSNHSLLSGNADAGSHNHQGIKAPDFPRLRKGSERKPFRNKVRKDLANLRNSKNASNQK